MVAFSGLAIYMWHPQRPALYLVPNQLREDEIMLDKVLEWEADGGVVWIDARSRESFDKSRGVSEVYLLKGGEKSLTERGLLID